MIKAAGEQSLQYVVCTIRYQTFCKPKQLKLQLESWVRMKPIPEPSSKATKPGSDTTIHHLSLASPARNPDHSGLSPAKGRSSTVVIISVSLICNVEIKSTHLEKPLKRPRLLKATKEPTLPRGRGALCSGEWPRAQVRGPV